MDEAESYAADQHYAPGTFGCHEALHMAAACAAMVDRELAEHPAVTVNPEWKRLAETAVDALNELYQAIGAKHVPGHLTSE